MVGGKILGGCQNRGVAQAAYVRIEVLAVGELEQLRLVLESAAHCRVRSVVCMTEPSFRPGELNATRAIGDTRQNPDGRSREATSSRSRGPEVELGSLALPLRIRDRITTTTSL